MIIDRAGTPVAKIVPLARGVNRRAVGALAGQLDLSGDWDSPETNEAIAAQQAAGKLGGPRDLAELVRDMGFRELPVTHAHAIEAGRLPVHHRDPFDRMLIAQARIEGLTLVTRDPDVQRYEVDLLVV
jgi:antitoxin (DNA-binding transcriptional repressor) of toxin-antitoxin stability system